MEAEAVTQSFKKKLLSKILENSQKITCDRVLIVMLQAHILQF